MPAQCTETCAAAFIPIYQDCSAEADIGSVVGVEAFVADCVQRGMAGGGAADSVSRAEF
eukprot:SAG11_NODE_27027_length_338_cov_0.422594_1_plen_58_part_01